MGFSQFNCLPEYCHYWYNQIATRLTSQHRRKSALSACLAGLYAWLVKQIQAD